MIKRLSPLVCIGLLFAVSCGRESDEKTDIPSAQTEAKIEIPISSTFNAEQPTGNTGYALNGQFSKQFNWPLIPLQAILLPNGKVFSYGTTNDGTQSGQFNYDIWNPGAGTEDNSHQWMPNSTKTDIFCSAASILPDSGDVLVAGGDTRNPVNFGINSALILNQNNSSLNRTGYMQFARWYPTAITLPNGETLIHGGKDGAGNAVATPEIFNNGKWRTLWDATNQEITSNDDGRWNYPRNWVAPNGRVFGISGNLMYFIDWGNNGGSQTVGYTPNKTRSYVSTAVMYQPGKILQAGGTVNGDVGARGSNQAITVDINNGNTPKIENLPNMAKERIWGNSTVLPNGEVLISGGSAFENKVIDPAQTAELWNPNTRQFRQVAKAATPRLYHSISLLLPDASVLVGGGGAPGPLNNLNAEIYYPPYLYDNNGNKAQRLVIDTIGARFKYNDNANVTFHGAGAVQRVTLIRTGAVTHSFDMGQRFLELGFTNNNGTLSVKLPNSANIAPPGYYLMFLVNQAGVPSVGRIIALNANGGDGGGAAPTPPPTQTVGSIKVGDVYQISARHSNKCIDVPASNAANGVDLQQYTCNGTNAQKFKVEQGANGAYILRNLASTRCMDIKSASNDNNALLQQWDCWEGSPSQNFAFDAKANGTFAIRSTKSNRCLFVPGANQADSVKLAQYDCKNGDANQEFYLKK